MIDIKDLLQSAVEYWHLQGRPHGRFWGLLKNHSDAVAGLEVSLLMEAGTIHCTPADMGFMEFSGPGVPPCIAYPSEYGAFLLVDPIRPPDEDPFFGGEAKNRWSKGMLQVVERARKAGCRWVKFDRDGPTIDGVERYVW